MILVLLSILLPLGLPREPHMPGRALLWSVTHLVLSSAPPWVQAITICQLHNCRTSLSELTEDVKRKKTKNKQQQQKSPNRSQIYHCSRKQKESPCRRALLISSTNCSCHHPEICCRHPLLGKHFPQIFPPTVSLLSDGTGGAE